MRLRQWTGKGKDHALEIGIMTTHALFVSRSENRCENSSDAG